MHEAGVFTILFVQPMYTVHPILKYNEVVLYDTRTHGPR